MENKEKLIEEIKKIEDETLIRFLYIFVTDLAKDNK